MILESSLLNRVERIPVLNGNFDVKRLDHESIVAFAELIVVENNTPSFFSLEKLELGSFCNLEMNLSDLKESSIKNNTFGLIC